MKTFRYRLGHIAGQTMTVGELKNALAEYPDDMPVLAEWESCRAYIEKSNFEICVVGKGHHEDECDSLVIDVNFY